MKREFIPFDLEVELVELGFNEKTFVYQLNGLCHNIEEDELANKNRILDFMREAPTGTCFFFQPEWSPNRTQCLIIRKVRNR